MGHAARANQRRRAVKKRIVFDGAGASDIFDALWLGFCVGRGLVLNVDEKQAGQSRDARRADLALKRALETSSMPALAGADKLPFFGDAQRVVTPGANIVWDQAQIDKLTAYINRVPWPTDKLDMCEAALDALSQAQEVEN